MKLIHTADLHINSPLTSAHIPPSRIAERKRELIDTFRAIVDYATPQDYGAVIIAGDLFDSETTGVRARDAITAAIGKCPDITFFYLPGNHEKKAFLPYAEKLSNLKVFGDDWTYFEFEDICIAGRAATTCDMFDTLNLSPRKKNIVVLHGELRDRSADGGIIGINDAAGRSIDYLALGHYHTYTEKEIDRRGVAVYSGTPEGRGFDETGEMGIVLLDTAGSGITHIFKPFSKRTLHDIPCDMGDVASQREAEDKIENLLFGLPARDIVRVRLTGGVKPGIPREFPYLVSRMNERFYSFEIKDECHMAISAEDYINDYSLKGEFIRLVLKDNSLTDVKKERIINAGLAALTGERPHE